ncbi:MAG: hypothetical protein ABI832_21415 [bacterium]
MHFVRSFEHDAAAMVSWGVRVLLVTDQNELGVISRRLAALGGKVEVAPELYAALSDLLDDPQSKSLLVLDCDSLAVGGLEAGQRAVQMMGEVAQRIPVILLSADCGEQRFPSDRAAPTVLRAPVSVVSLKVGFEHALRDRLLYQAA